uniref:Phlebovirus glycoprotein G2 fusion domain-containing protein n=1 Tax=Acrobeloides nanus TaxID=290746 RepID=A0A914EGW0_9BILA
MCSLVSVAQNHNKQYICSCPNNAKTLHLQLSDQNAPLELNTTTNVAISIPPTTICFCVCVAGLNKQVLYKCSCSEDKWLLDQNDNKYLEEAASSLNNILPHTTTEAAIQIVQFNAINNGGRSYLNSMSKPVDNDISKDEHMFPIVIYPTTTTIATPSTINYFDGLVLNNYKSMLNKTDIKSLVKQCLNGYVRGTPYCVCEEGYVQCSESLCCLKGPWHLARWKKKVRGMF